MVAPLPLAGVKAKTGLENLSSDKWHYGHWRDIPELQIRIKRMEVGEHFHVNIKRGDGTWIDDGDCNVRFIREEFVEDPTISPTVA
jgi:hypothetical protein